MKKLLLFLFSAFAFAACEQAPIKEMQGAAINERNLEVSFEGGDDTRIQLQNGKTVWTEGDHVSVFYRSTINEEWQFDGETGDRTGQIVPVDNSVNPPATHNRVVVIYPYNNEYYLNTEKYSIEASLPAVQNYLRDSYGTNGNIMVSSNDYKQVSLKSVCGWLKLQLTGDGEVVKSITFKGNNGEQVAGELHINTSDATCVLASASGDAGESEVGGTLVRPGTILTEVTLDCGEGVALGKNATAFYIALPPQTFEQGFTVEIEDTEGYVMKQPTDKALIIERNHIQPMAAFEFINPATPSAPAPASNEIWYTATAKVEPTFDDALTFGADVVSNVWDSETKRGIIAFDGDVTMIGDDVFYNCDKLTSVTLPECVISIGKKAFYDCDGLTEFTIPDSVTEIGTSAFYGCDKLTIVTIGDSVTTIGNYAFEYCTSLTSVTIPDSVTTIGGGAFFGCSSLTSVNIPDSVTTIGNDAFYGCNSLTSVNIGDSVTTIGESAFYSCDSLTSVNIGDSVTTIGYKAFCDCTSLTSVNIPDSVTTIGDAAFYSCDSLKEFKGKFATEDGRSLIVDNTIIAYANDSGTTYTIPNSVTEIGSSAFASCDSLTSVNIPDSVTTIGGGAFFGCSILTSVTIGDSVTTIGNYAFQYCYSMTSVYCKATTPPALGSYVFDFNSSARRIYVYEECVELYKSAWSGYKDSIYTNGENCPETKTILYTTYDGNTITPSELPIISNIYENGVGTLVFSSKQIPNDAFRYCYSLTSVNIPDNVTSIGEDAFGDCESLTSVSIGNSVTTIGMYAFRNCTSLTSVTIGDSVTTIGYEAFRYCTSLTSVNIPDSVTTIGNSAFRDCRSLTSVYCKATTPPSLGYYVFGSFGSGRKIYVPAGSVEVYKSATNWSEYKSAIVGYDFENGVVVE